ncbi:kinase-like protein [Gymnopus androsaceus JB14]|uniref:Kinase-like protein n=1 Tax=Gymnopus androsaceus JB14 TaxID=1447944 RepID=A0A6A4GQW6_9AGAR|nr:kinase-like protein [Gymnopus androsaceus JB14]
MSDFELTGDTLDTSDDIGSISSTLDTLDIGESAQKPSKLEDSLASVTYGELVDSIRACRLKVYEYRDYLTPRTSPPSEEDWPWSFVSKVDDLSDAKGKGRDFLVYAGFLYQRNFRLSPSPSFRSPSYGDTYARPSSGSGGGSGSFASAYSSQRTAVALKESVRSIHRSGNRPALIGAFLKEIRFITRLESCRNIISMFGVAFIGVGDEVKPALVLELALSNLTEFIKEGFNGTSVSWNLKTLFASQICDALQALHSHGFIHADVKGQNVLIFSHKKSEFCAKLSDFGNCVPLNATAPYIAAGTQYYLAPECLVLDNSIIPSSHRAWGDLYGNAQYRDIYAFGLLVWELATNCECPPFFDLSTDAVDVVQMKHSDSDQAMGYLLDRVPPHTPTHLRGVISGALRTNPQKRALLIDIGREFEQVLSLQINLSFSPQ